MRLLLDTHAFLWWIVDDPQLSSQARALIADPENRVQFSTASAWEIAIKVGKGLLDLPDDPKTFIATQLERNGFGVLPVGLDHALRVASLPHHHRDPFDRMLVAQSLVEDMALVSRDPLLLPYGVRTIW